MGTLFLCSSLEFLPCCFCRIDFVRGEDGHSAFFLEKFPAPLGLYPGKVTGLMGSKSLLKGLGPKV